MFSGKLPAGPEATEGEVTVFFGHKTTGDNLMRNVRLFSTNSRLLKVK